MQRIWISHDVVIAIHEAQLAEHGGASGIKDIAFLESALAHPLNFENYGEPDIADLAASYACGVAGNHPFVDGNKRTAFVVMELFLELNGQELKASDAACVETMLKVAAGEMDQEAMAAWIRANL
ncbi:type II toxin-antitoxin system death-on-curing family toxin [Skermanella sp. TT6]|uniref:Type II toxin-antitoxin system death-on-curing family toxin n=1 Tax=Skermanella cutis TaxID=2775420 RepID=A0ABX7BB50_9PROT|nr:type II toxin-antitoxin system death-on-curing family toxin [Skermanella sp. TT6]QQP89657.1 type II toxin-antitoxin system death-on-curing family toxin [Skermanella sp. TT6]